MGHFRDLVGNRPVLLKSSCVGSYEEPDACLVEFAHEVISAGVHRAHPRGIARELRLPLSGEGLEQRDLLKRRSDRDALIDDARDLGRG